MALLTLCRTPSLATPPDETFQRRGRLQKRESFALVKGAVHLLEDEENAHRDEDVSSTEESEKAPDAQSRQLHAMVEQLRPEDTMKLAVQLESVSSVRVRYLIVVSTLGNKEESLLLGMDFPNSESDHCTIGLVMPIWSDTQVYLDGDGGFSITSAEETKIFKPVSMQTMWSVLQVLHGCCERALKAVVIPGNGLEWAQHYHQHIESDRFCLNEWEAMTDLESVRRDSEERVSEDSVSKEKLIKKHMTDIMSTEDLDNLTCRMVYDALQERIGFDMKPFKKYIDNEILVTIAQMDKPSKIFDYLYLGSEWNAANLEELHKNNVGYILNVTREIDNFFPDSFTYMNVRLYDEETTDLLPHWTDTYKFINTARKSGQAVLVHCKMGISRSGSTVIAYAMKQQRWPLDVALAYVKERRSIIKPNEAFMKQLQTYDGILKASQQRHSALWRRRSVRKEEGGEEDENEDDDEGLEDGDEESLSDHKDSDTEDDSEETCEVFGEPTSQGDASTEPEHSAPQEINPAVTGDNPEAVSQLTIPVSVNRSGRMNLFSLMQSISEMEDVNKELCPGSPRRSPGQRRRSQGRRGLTHQRACLDASPDPQRRPDAGSSET
ncbi:protein phosphatase Slingshot homolog 3 isoform X1 [Takifugu flavidus]|uniref:protein phosphatase Slingshot homolog 3 isoform X1 n=1 Tax=Takifugu flavidus TaxID=433684 RepID=UPI002544B400|nr:protein phosphatase Slingshot homolog 3 isoform X1 [Takifugu flavidus]XP_056899878.1 protein phosphatase Slingshot homolog 3 isoform X1 [Takifugu flavidus]